MVRSKSTVVAFLVGAATGSIVALLTTPSSGEELREKLRLKRSELYHRGKEKAQEAGAEARRTGQMARERLRQEQAAEERRPKPTTPNT